MKGNQVGESCKLKRRHESKWFAEKSKEYGWGGRRGGGGSGVSKSEATGWIFAKLQLYCGKLSVQQVLDLWMAMWGFCSICDDDVGCNSVWWTKSMLTLGDVVWSFQCWECWEFFFSSWEYHDQLFVSVLCNITFKHLNPNSAHLLLLTSFTIVIGFVKFICDDVGCNSVGVWRWWSLWETNGVWPFNCFWMLRFSSINCSWKHYTWFFVPVLCYRTQKPHQNP